MKTKGFTLIELLVVISIIAVLLSILMPSLRLVRDQARRIHCISNVKSLALGWYMYKDDNKDNLVPGNTGNGCWVTNPPNGATLEQQKDAIRAGQLFSYVSKETGIYHCPADRRTQGVNRAFLTFSIPGGANGEDWAGHIKITKYSDIKKSAETYIFVEEADVRGTNVGSWQMDPTAKTWVDPVAMWHNKQSTLGFADGHAEMHPWEDKSFIDWNLKAMYNNGFSFNMTPPANERTDIEYMSKGFPNKKK
jgi:prepilin-type N-terminal cleavage/methylation domain-containing protein/prepilin-type processing-associated H-X9-DG protein